MRSGLNKLLIIAVFVVQSCSTTQKCINSMNSVERRLHLDQQKSIDKIKIFVIPTTYCSRELFLINNRYSNSWSCNYYYLENVKNIFGFYRIKVNKYFIEIKCNRTPSDYFEQFKLDTTNNIIKMDGTVYDITIPKEDTSYNFHFKSGIGIDKIQYSDFLNILDRIRQVRY